MAQKTNKNCIDEKYSKPPKNYYSTNKTDVFHINDVRRLDITNIKDNGLEEDRGYRYVFVVIDNFSQFV